MKRVLALFLLAAFLALPAHSQTNQFRTRMAATAADAVIDSLQVASNQRVYINHIFAWYDNAANTNVLTVELVQGMTAMAVQGSGRLFRHSEAMTSAGIKRIVFEPVNIMTERDSTVYIRIDASTSDSLLVGYTYTIVTD